MSQLEGAVAYKVDLIPELQQEISCWENVNKKPIEFRCPGKTGNPCDVLYSLYVHSGASAERIKEYIDDARQGLQGWCPEEHAFRITMHGGPKEGKLTRFYVYVDSPISTL